MSIRGFYDLPSAAGEPNDNKLSVILKSSHHLLHNIHPSVKPPHFFSPVMKIDQKIDLPIIIFCGDVS
jgi:hypothetical protein